MRRTLYISPTGIGCSRLYPHHAFNSMGCVQNCVCLYLYWNLLRKTLYNVVHEGKEKERKLCMYIVASLWPVPSWWQCNGDAIVLSVCLCLFSRLESKKNMIGTDKFGEWRKPYINGWIDISVCAIFYSYESYECRKFHVWASIGCSFRWTSRHLSKTNILHAFITERYFRH